MKILINALLLGEKNTGIGNYILNIFSKIASLDKNNQYILYVNKKIYEKIKNKFGTCEFIFAYLNPDSSFKRIMIEQLYLPHLVNKIKPDIFHNPDHVLPFLPVLSKKIITVHDLTFLKHPEAFLKSTVMYKKLMMKNAIKKVDMIIADSDNTKNDVMQYFKLPEKKIQTVYISIADEYGIRDKNSSIRIMSSKYHINKPFILFTGTIEPRKNVISILKAYYELKKRKGFEHLLVIAGKKGWLYNEIFDFIKEKCLQDEIIFLDYVDQGDMPSLYCASDLFIYPSIYEGFGLPVLEAMACGTPVITSNVSSLPEVAGDAAVLVDPMNIGEITDAINNVLNNRDLWNKLRVRGLENVKRFSWDRAAKETTAIYQKVGQST